MLLGSLLLSVLSAFFIPDFYTSENENIISTKQGKVKGKTMTSFNGKLFSAYLGIPFGKVTKRFTSPEPADTWSEIRDATEDPPPCKQFDVFVRNAITGVEDCLYLNIYTPKLKMDNSTKEYPVIVFFYGGGFSMGEITSTVYAPERYMNKDIVLVLPSYRVGPFGFLSTNDTASPGNYGLLDQVLALKWIQDNIESFGGNKSQVTISGVSAGGGAVGLHLVSKQSGLFHGAIAQSGSLLCPWALENDPLTITKKLAERVHCLSDSTQQMVDCLREVEADELVKALQFSGEISNENALSILPVIENSEYGQFLTESPIALLKEGRFNKVPVIIGMTAEESAPVIQFGEMSGNLPNYTDIHSSNFEKIFWTLTGVHQTDKIKLDKIVDQYFGDANFSDVTQIKLREVMLSSDVMFNSGIVKTVSMLSNAGVPVYMYVLDYIPDDLASSNYSGKPDVVHGNDLLFLFNWTTFGSVKDNNFTGDALEVSNIMLNSWFNFANSGNPNPLNSIAWLPSPSGEIHYLNITKPNLISMKTGFRTSFMEFWNERLYDVNCSFIDTKYK